MNEKFKLILENTRNENIFSFIENKDLAEELNISFSYFIFLSGLIDSGNKQDELSKVYIQTTNIYIGSVVEALLYEYVLESLKKQDPNKIKRYCKNISYIEKHITNGILRESLVVCEKKEKNIEFKDDISFQSLINGVKDYKLLSDEKIGYLEEIRQNRNIVHLKVLVNFKKGGNEFNDLADLIDKYIEIFNEIKIRFIELNQ